MDKGLTVPKWELINLAKIPQNLSAQIVCPSQKVRDFDEKRLHWASVVRGLTGVYIHAYCSTKFAVIFRQDKYRKTSA